LAFLAKNRPFSRISGPRSRGVLHQPLAPGPRGAENAVFPGFPGEGPKRHFLGGFWENPRFSGFSSPGPRRVLFRLPGDRGAPARGVDVKPPSRGPPGPAPGLPGTPWLPRDPPRVRRPLREAPEAILGPLRGPGTPPGAPGRGVLHQPLAPGPRGSRRALPGPGTPSSGGGAGEEPPLLICRSGGAHRRGCARVSPQGCSVLVVESMMGVFKVSFLILCPSDAGLDPSSTEWAHGSQAGDSPARAPLPRGRPPRPLSGAYPRPFGTGTRGPGRALPGTPGGNRGAPPRGVDVKQPLRRGPGRPQGA